MSTPRKIWAVLAPDGHIKHLEQDEQWARDQASASDSVTYYVAPSSAWGLFLSARAAILHECFRKGMTPEQAARHVACDPMQARLIGMTDTGEDPYADAIESGDVLPAIASEQRLANAFGMNHEPESGPAAPASWDALLDHAEKQAAQRDDFERLFLDATSVAEKAAADRDSARERVRELEARLSESADAVVKLGAEVAAWRATRKDGEHIARFEIATGSAMCPEARAYLAALPKPVEPVRCDCGEPCRQGEKLCSDCILLQADEPAAAVEAPLVEPEEPKACPVWCDRLALGMHMAGCPNGDQPKPAPVVPDVARALELLNRMRPYWRPSSVSVSELLYEAIRCLEGSATTEDNS